MKTVRSLFFSIVLVLIISSCEGPEGPQGSDGPIGPNLIGEITGFVKLLNEDGTPVNDNSGVNVTVEGTQISATTDLNGKYLLSNLSTGIYNIYLWKTGYCSYKYVGKEFTGGGQAYYGIIDLIALPSFSVTNFAILSSPSPDEIRIVGRISNTDQHWREVRLFFYNTDLVSSDPSHYLHTTTTSISPNEYGFDINYSINPLYQIGFSGGDACYIAAYSSSSSIRYPDPNTGRYFYTGISNTFLVDSCIVP